MAAYFLICASIFFSSSVLNFYWCFWWAMVSISWMQAFVLGGRDFLHFWWAAVLLYWLQAFMLGERDFRCFWWAAVLLSWMWAFVLGDRDCRRFWWAEVLFSWMRAFESGERDFRYFHSASALFSNIRALESGKRDAWYFWAWVLICVDGCVVTMVEIICQLLPYILNPFRNASCSACVHLPLFGFTVKTSVFENNDD